MFHLSLFGVFGPILLAEGLEGPRRKSLLFEILYPVRHFDRYFCLLLLTKPVDDKEINRFRNNDLFAKHF